MVLSKNFKFILLFSSLSTLFFQVEPSCWESIKTFFSPTKESGEIISKSIEINPFTKISLKGLGDVFITQGDHYSLKIECDSTLYQQIDSFVKNETLFIENTRKKTSLFSKKSQTPKFYITLQNLDELNKSGYFSIKSQDLKVNDLKINLSGMSKINFDNLKANKLDITSSGKGSINLAGEVNSQNIKISGLGNYSAQNLVSNECKVSISGIGSASVFVKEKLDAAASGSSKIIYKGNPKNTNFSSSGLSRIIKK